MNTEELSVLTIDPPDTKLKEDGFCVDHKTKEICIVSAIPDYSKSNYEVIANRIKTGTPRKLPREYFFNTRKALDPKEYTSVIFCSTTPPYETASIGVGEAAIGRAFTFDQVDKNWLDADLRLLRKFASSLGFSPTSDSRLLVSCLLRYFNQVARDAMIAKGIPYLSEKKGVLSISGGKVTVNKPYRDVVSYINVAQLSSWIKTGMPAFTRKDLELLIPSTPIK